MADLRRFPKGATLRHVFPDAEEGLVADLQFPDEMTEDDAPEFGDPDRPWMITDDGGAEWAMSRLARAERLAAETKKLHEVYLTRLRFWLEDRMGPVDRDRDYFSERLRDYALRQRAADPALKTLHLPSGRVETTLHKDPKIEIVDKKAILHWAETALDVEQQETVVKVEKSVLVSELRKVVDIVETEDGDLVPVTANGEIVPGVTIRPPHISAVAKAEL